jgi:hypothetical protein
MRREKAPTRSRWFWIVVAGLIGFLLGDRHAGTWQSIGVSPSENVALRFPEPKDEANVADADAAAPAETTSGVATGAIRAPVLGGAQLALLNPEPMMPAPARRPAPPVSASAPNPQAVTSPQVAAPPVKVAVMPRPRAEPKLATQAADGASRYTNRPGSMLNDAQIASIKQRLHLTADQESMWPAVEAALRNVAYARARDAHRPGAPASAAQLASADPDSVEVQGLKSAAVPLIMSFSEEQKHEVRNLAHVMGLDKLASEL